MILTSNQSFSAWGEVFGDRVIATAIVDRLLHHAVTLNIGFVPGDAARSRANFLALMAQTDDSATRRARFAEAMQVHRSEWQAIDLDIGFHYELGAVVPDGSDRPPRDPWGHQNTPTGRPGHRLPHVWLLIDGQQRSSLDLVATGRFTLFVEGAGDAWRAAVQALPATSPPVDVVVVADSGPVADRSGEFLRQCGLQPGGALPVRPDQHTAWRHVAGPDGQAATSGTVDASGLAQV